MPDYENEPGGLLFLEREPKTDKHPFITGRIRQTDGTEVRLSGWWVTDRESGEKKKTSTGSYMVSVKLEADEHRATKAGAEDIPF